MKCKYCEEIYSKDVFTKKEEHPCQKILADKLHFERKKLAKIEAELKHTSANYEQEKNQYQRLRDDYNNKRNKVRELERQAQDL